jgi:hypothetical protein
VGAAVVTTVLGATGAAAAEAPTFNKDVAPIIYEKCASCHRPGEVAPMSLLSYQEARPWVRSIKAKVASREMPPWFADDRYSTFADKKALTKEQVDTIVKWVDAGAPQGVGKAPAAPKFVEGWSNFMNRPPDAIVEMPMRFDIPAEGELPNFTIWGPNPFKEDKFMEAVQLRPEVISATHHSDVVARPLPEGTKLGRGPAWPGGPDLDFAPMYPDGTSYSVLVGGGDLTEREHSPEFEKRREEAKANAFRTQGDSMLLFYVPGGGYQKFPAGAAKRISAKNNLTWALHYTPTGKPEKDSHRLGLWYTQTAPTHEVLTQRVGETHIAEGQEFGTRAFSGGGGGETVPNIPPMVSDWKITAITTFKDDVTLYGMWPHMHVRGKDMTFLATFPDGREQVLLHVPKYDFNWQLQYQLVEPVKLPAGSTIKTIGHYDNSPSNRYNPAPDKPVYWSEQSWDEMFNGWMEVSVDKDVLNAPKTTTQQQQQQ